MQRKERSICEMGAVFDARQLWIFYFRHNKYCVELPFIARASHKLCFLP
jgi:hypothetical protein